MTYDSGFDDRPDPDLGPTEPDAPDADADAELTDADADADARADLAPPTEPQLSVDPDAPTNPDARADLAPPAEPQLSVDLDAIAADLADVEVALARLANGTYWTDEITGAPLPDDLLEATPIARRLPGA